MFKRTFTETSPNPGIKLFLMLIIASLFRPALSRMLPDIKDCNSEKLNPLPVTGLFDMACQLQSQQYISDENFFMPHPPIFQNKHNTFFTPKEHTARTEDEKINYKGIPIKYIDMIKPQCEKKKIGHSDGKICRIDGVKYYMKSWEDANQNALLGAYNLRFLKNVLDITVPSIKILSDKGVLYFGSVEIPDFVSASIFKVYHYRNDGSIAYNSYRKILVETIGENGIAKFMVALTFIRDLKFENWGYNNQGLVLIDVDIAPRKLPEFFDRHEEFTQFGIALSFNNIQQMREIYHQMLTKQLPTIDASVDLAPDVYQQVVDIFIKACDQIIENFHIQFPSLSKNSYSHKINECFLEHIEKFGNELVNNDFHSELRLRRG